MTDKTVKPPIVHQSSNASLDESLTDHCGRIVGSSMAERSGTLEDALGDDDEQFIRTVMSILETRSDEVKKALEKALLHGEQNGTPAGLTTYIFLFWRKFRDDCQSPVRRMSDC